MLHVRGATGCQAVFKHVHKTNSIVHIPYPFQFTWCSWRIRWSLSSQPLQPNSQLPHSAPNRTTGTMTSRRDVQQRAQSLHEETQSHSTWLILNAWARLLRCYDNWSRKGLGALHPFPHPTQVSFILCRKYDFIIGMQTCLLHLSFLLICYLFLHVISLINIFIEVIYNVVLISAVQQRDSVIYMLRLSVGASVCDPVDCSPLSTEFSRQEYWNGLPFPSPGDLPDPGIEPRSPVSSVLYW